MTIVDVLHMMRQRAADLRTVANTMPNTSGGRERLKAAEEIGRLANEIERKQS
jgi:hypothetical protein